MKEYGKLEYAPQEIRAQIVDLEQHSMTKVQDVLLTGRASTVNPRLSEPIGQMPQTFCSDK